MVVAYFIINGIENNSVDVEEYKTKINTFCTEEEYEKELTKTGNYGKYVLMENKYVRLPTIN